MAVDLAAKSSSTRRRDRRHVRSRRSMAGTTLLELTITIGLVLIVVGVMLDSLGSAQRSERYASDRTEALDSMRSAIARFTKDVRQADGVDENGSASHLEADTYVQGAVAHVVYDASGGVLTRTVGSAPTETLIDRLATDAIFTYEPTLETAEVVTIVLEVEPMTSPETTIELTSEVRMRNRTSG
jgi:type II secretory pathway pseudopilin PulG